MADRLVITIDGDSSGLNKALTSAETRLNNFNTRISNTSRALTNMMKNLTAMGSSVRDVTAACTQISTALGAATAQVNNFSNSINRVTANNRAAATSTGTLNLGVKDLVLTLYSVRALLFTGKSLFGGIFSEIVEANSEFEKSQILLANVAGHATAAQNAMQARSDQRYIWDMAAKAPIAVGALTEAFVHMKANGLNPAQGSLQALVDITAKFGGSTENFKKAQLALTQMASSGKIMMQDLKLQLAQSSGIASAEKDFAEAAGFGRTAQSVQKLFAAMKKGAVESADVLPKVFAIWERDAGGAAAKFADTWDGLQARLTSAWTQTLIRMTQEGGSDSLFAVLKKQVLDLVTYLNTDAGDSFIKEVSEDLGQLVVALSDGIKWIYQYRNEILELLKVVAGFIVFRTATGLVKGLIGTVADLARVVTGAIGYISAFNNLMTDLATAPNAAARSIALFGQGFTTLATSMGIFTATGSVALGTLALWTGGLAVGAIAVGALVYAIYEWTKAQTASKATLEALNATHDHAKTVIDANSAAIDKLMRANDKEREGAEANVKTQIELTRQLMLRTIAAEKAYIATAKLAQADYLAAKQSAEDNKAKFGSTGVMGSAGADVGAGADMNIANQKFINAKARVDGLKKVFSDAAASYKDMNAAIAASDAEANKPKEDSSAAGKAAKDKLGSLDAKRQALVTQLMKIKELQASIDDAGDDKKKNEFADNSLEIEENIRAQVGAIKSQDELNKKYLEARAIVRQKTLDEREHTKALRDLAKEKQQADNLDGIAADKADEAAIAFGKLGDSYNAVADSVKRYADKLLEKNKEVLSDDRPENDENRIKAGQDIENAKRSETIRLISEEAVKDKEKTDTILEGLMTQDQVRQKNYDKEVARINGILAITPTDTKTGRDLTASLEAYKQAIDLQNRIDSNPFAKWAVGVKDLKTGIDTTLTGSLDGFIDNLSQGKLAFGDFAKSLLTDLAKVIIKALLAKAILSALGLGGSTINIANPDTSGIQGLGITAPIMHTGGPVGGLGGASRSVSADMFAFAQRYHTGGFPGLKHDEVPIIAQKGEGVFTAEQMKAMGNNKGTPGGVAPQVNIINQTSTPVSQSQTQPRFDGEKFVVDILLKNANKPGPIRDMLKGR